MERIDPQSWKAEMGAFREKTDAFYAGKVDKMVYKGFSGKYGSYAQRGGAASMLRLRMNAGRIPKDKLKFVADSIAAQGVTRVHFTTCQTIQLHDLQPAQIYPIMTGALDHGIVTMGGGGDFPRNVMCSPLAGVEQGEYFDVLPYAEAAAEYLLGFVNAEKMPRKLKVGFSGTPANLTHATYRDLGFAARPDGRFDVYSAGGLGNNPKLGVRVAEAVEPERILYYIKAMWLTFLAYGNYVNRGRARTRYMQESLGGPEAYQAAYREKLAEVLASGEDLTLRVEPQPVTKKGDGTAAAGPRVTAQKQPGLYAVLYHPIGGLPPAEKFGELYEAIREIEGAELRLAPDESVYIINLTGAEAEKLLAVTADSGVTPFERSVACIGSSTCQVGLRDSQALLREAVAAVRAAGLPADALPQIHISGCLSSCGTHQTGAIGFHGTVKRVGGKPREAFMLFAGGSQTQGAERMGASLGAILAEDIPPFLVEVGRAAAASGQSFAQWYAADPEVFAALARPYLEKQ